MKTSSIEDVDVLCGRGNGINMLPGNIRFRKLVDQNRSDYVAAHRHSKSAIASKVLDGIRGVGGRFLAFDKGPEQWLEVPLKRALEKCSQALREQVDPKTMKKIRRTEAPAKPKPRNSEGKPTINSAASSSSDDDYARKPRTNYRYIQLSEPSTKKDPPMKKQLHEPVDFTETRRSRYFFSYGSKKTINDFKDEDLLAFIAPHDLTELQLLEQKEASTAHVTTPRHTSSTSPPLVPYHFIMKDDDWDDVYKTLMRFRVAFGHTGVPPNWAGDARLAEWASGQRQIYREVHTTRHRPASTLERSRLEKLKAIDFVWDWNEWHWNKCYTTFQRQQKSLGEPKFTPSLLQWFDQQQELLLLKHHQYQLSEKKIKKLQALFGSRDDSEGEEEADDSIVI